MIKPYGYVSYDTPVRPREDTMTTDQMARLDALRKEWQTADGDGTVFSFCFSEAQAFDLASGFVPPDVRAMFLAALDWAEDDRRRGARNVDRALMRAQRPKKT